MSLATSDKLQVTSKNKTGTQVWLWTLLACHLSLVTCHMVASAAVSKGKNQQLEVAETNQGGGRVSSSNFRQQATIGSSVAGGRLSSSRFRIIPGFIGAGLSGPTNVPVSELDLTVLYAKTDPLGADIPTATWQRDRDPIFMWQAPPTGPDLAGYSFAIDATPDETVDTTQTSFDVMTSELRSLPDGRHTFSVKAINTAGNAGKPISMELWVDTTAPQVGTYGPTPGALLNLLNPSVSAVVTDAASGLNLSATSLSVNGTPISLRFDAPTNTLTGSGGAWKEGANSLELRAVDAVGNSQTPLIWSVTIDTTPPAGRVLINGDAQMTTSVYVTLELSASDATSGVARMLISNEELSGYVEEPYAAQRELWRLNAVRGTQTVYVKFVDKAGNVSEPVSDAIELGLLAPETVITSGPAGFSQDRSATFQFMCPERECVFSYAFDNDEWSAWSPAASATKSELAFGNHYVRVKAAKEVNGLEGIQPDEEDPTPAERTWVVGVESPVFTVPKGPPIKVWRLE